MVFDDSYVDYSSWRKERLEYLRKIRYPASISMLWDAAHSGVITVPKKMYSTAVNMSVNEHNETYIPLWVLWEADEGWIRVNGAWKRVK